MSYTERSESYALPPTKRNRLALAAFVLEIFVPVGYIVGWTYLFSAAGHPNPLAVLPLLSLIALIVGIILGHVSRAGARKQLRGSNLGKAAFIMGYSYIGLALILVITVIVFIYIAFHG
jgi:hypothetical protein